MPDPYETSEIPLKNELPFTYQRVEDPEQAEFKINRLPPGGIVQPMTDGLILEKIRHEKEMKEWYTSPEWRRKGLPYEQVHMKIANDKEIDIYNYDDENQLTEEHLESAKRVLEKLSGSFPQVLDKITNVLINDVQEPSMFGDPQKYPLSGRSINEWKVFLMMPIGMSLKEYRIPGVNHFEAVFMHELTHLLEDMFKNVWKENFTWVSWETDRENYELRKSPDGRKTLPFNKITGEMLPKLEIPLEPEQCVDYYAKLNWQEDLCESMVAYFYNPELLKKISPKKYEILKSLDKKSEIQKVIYKRIPEERIGLPRIEPQTVTYYIEEDKPYPFRSKNNRRDINTSK